MYVYTAMQEIATGHWIMSNQFVQPFNMTPEGPSGLILLYKARNKVIFVWTYVYVI